MLLDILMTLLQPPPDPPPPTTTDVPTLEFLLQDHYPAGAESSVSEPPILRIGV